MKQHHRITKDGKYLTEQNEWTGKSADAKNFYLPEVKEN